MQETIDEPELCPEEIVRMADEIRQAHHPEIAEAVIGYVFVPKGPRKGGKVSLGKAKRETEAHKLLSDVDFIVTLSYDQWVLLSDAQRRALLDHELCHCAPKVNKDGDRTGWTVRRHDIEDFAAVVERHGLVFETQREYGRRTLKQLQLEFAKAEGQ